MTTTKFSMGVSNPFALSDAVLRVRYFFHPIDRRSVERFLNCDMRHRRLRRRAVPVLFAGFKPHNVARADFLDRPAFTLNASEPRRYNQRLAERVRMPSRARARLEGDVRAAHAGGLRRFEQRIHPYGAGEIS